MSYIDDNGLYHDKKVIDGKQSSGNPLIYSSFARHLGLTIDRDKIKVFFDKCFKQNSNGWEIKRYPDDREQTKGSRDEIIGAISLGLLSPIMLIAHNYRYNYQSLEFSKWKIIKAFIYISGEHRNFAQDKNVEYVYPVMYWLGYHDQYYVDKMYRTWFNKSTYFRWFMFQVYVLSTILQNNISAKNVLWLQLKDLDSKFWIKFINQKENYKKYFEKEHIFNTYLERLK